MRFVIILIQVENTAKWLKNWEPNWFIQTCCTIKFTIDSMGFVLNIKYFNDDKLPDPL